MTVEIANGRTSEIHISINPASIRNRPLEK